MALRRFKQRVDALVNLAVGSPPIASAPPSRGIAVQGAMILNGAPAVIDAAGGGFLYANRFRFLAGVGAIADDVTLTTGIPADSRILDVFVIISAPIGASTVQVRTAVGGAGAAVSDLFSGAGAGYVRNAVATGTVVLAGGTALYLRRSDNTVAGEVVVIALRNA